MIKKARRDFSQWITWKRITPWQIGYFLPTVPPRLSDRNDLVLDWFGKPEQSRDKCLQIRRNEKEQSLVLFGEGFRDLTHSEGLVWDHDYYHNIGYLIASGTMTLQKSLNCQKLNKKWLPDSLDGFIKILYRNQGELFVLSYEKSRIIEGHYTLLLFNVVL
jgi:hypothetical protein